MSVILRGLLSGARVTVQGVTYALSDDLQLCTIGTRERLGEEPCEILLPIGPDLRWLEDMNHNLSETERIAIVGGNALRKLSAESRGS